jgi:hypothetical protein
MVKAFLGDHEVSATVNGRKIDTRDVLDQAGKMVTTTIKP